MRDQEAQNREGESPSTDQTQSFSEERVWDVLRSCYDPELPINIVDLGLIYACRVMDIDPGGHRVEVDMTLTAPGCGMGEILKMDIQQKLMELPTVREAHVSLVFEPPWDPSRMSDAARLEVGLM
jgi:probable FeS assembly SUF system protein SufT